MKLYGISPIMQQIFPVTSRLEGLSVSPGALLRISFLHA